MKNEDKNPDEAVAVDEAIAEMKELSIPLTQAIKKIIDETYIGNVIAIYDTEVDFDSAEVCKDAAEFVVKGIVGAICYNLFQGFLDQGAKALNRALDQVDSAAERDAGGGNEQSQDQLAERIKWAARMDVQQSYRKALREWSAKLHVAVTGERYSGKGAPRLTNRPDSLEQSTAAKLRARRRAV